MATLSSTTSERIITIGGTDGKNKNYKFKGLNLCPDGDTNLGYGEASMMLNWKVTRDGNLKRRAGCRAILSLLRRETSKPIQGMWTGNVGKKEQFVAACDGRLWRLWDADTNSFIKEEIGSVDTTNRVCMFGFGGNLYMLNGAEYRQWDGTLLESVEGYRPLIGTALEPNGTFTTDEQVNKLNGKRRVWISPDGEENTFKLPEEFVSIDYVLDLLTGEELAVDDDYTIYEDTITFQETPTQATNSYEVGYTVDTSYRFEVESMTGAELYGTSTDSQVFLYGNGTNECFYSGIDRNGNCRADYFPDLNECAVGDSNTCITGMIRHLSKLVVFKENSTWVISQSTTTLSDGSLIDAYYITPVNRTIGNAAHGMVQLVNNNPLTLFGKDCWQWKSTSSYSKTLTQDERTATRISDRIHAALAKFDFSETLCYDDNANQEYYISYDCDTLVYNYAMDAWYQYDTWDMRCACSFHGMLYFGTSDGTIMEVSDDYLSDKLSVSSDTVSPISARWESGSMSFGQDYMRKAVAMLWIALKPEASGELVISVITDRKAISTEKVLNSDLFDFSRIDFGDFVFSTNRQPQMYKTKIKSKKFVFYKLVFSSDTVDTTSTVLAADIRVRYTGYAKS